MCNTALSSGHKSGAGDYCCTLFAALVFACYAFLQLLLLLSLTLKC